MKITVATQAFNAKNYISTCVNSVLSQTYSNFEFIIIDNGCNDGTTEILQNFAKQDERIKLIRYEENVFEERWIKAILEFGTGEYFTNLDADDWLEPDYLSKLVTVALKYDADIAATGTIMHDESSKNEYKRALFQQLVINKPDFAVHYPNYHAHFRTIWGKLIRTSLITDNYVPLIADVGFSYGIDTLLTFSILRNSSRICVDNSALHHYRVHKKSTSYKYDPKRSESDLLLYNDALDFLSAYGPISERNMEFINIVYANAIFDTVKVLDNCNLPATEKLKELRIIADREETKKAYRVDHPHTKKSKGTMLVAALQCGQALPEESEDFRVVVDTLLPACGRTVRKETIELFALDNSLLNTLATDNRDEYLKHLLSIISEKKYTKKFDFGKIVATLAHDKPILNTIDDVKFIRKHQDIYLEMWNRKYLDALHHMTDYLLSGEKADEAFLILYLNLSAALEKVDEFVFGKTRIAVLYFNHKQYDKCKEILDDLTDMGVEDTEEIAVIRQKLN